jgi:hypothetical protein
MSSGKNGVIRIIMGWRSRDSVQEIKNFTPKSQYIFCLLLFVVNNKDQFIVNLETYSINTIQLPISNDLRQIWLYVRICVCVCVYIYIYQKGVYYLGIKVFKSSLQHKNFSNNPEEFKIALKVSYIQITFIH